MNEWWGGRIDVPVCIDAPQGADPEGALCLFCNEPCDGAWQRGLWMPYLDSDGTTSVQPVHYECDLRQVIGSLGHQKARCHCFKGLDGEENPPWFTEHEAALAAALEYFLTRPLGRPDASDQP